MCNSVMDWLFRKCPDLVWQKLFSVIVLPEDFRNVAVELALTLRHIQKVLNGTAVSYRVMEQLIRIGMQNRENGIFRKKQKPYQPLIFLFSEAELNGEEA